MKAIGLYFSETLVSAYKYRSRYNLEDQYWKPYRRYNIEELNKKLSGRSVDLLMHIADIVTIAM
jgi:hypothetical protein